MPKLDKLSKGLPEGAVDLGDGEKLKPVEKTHMSHNVKNADNSEEDADDDEWHFKNVAVVQMYSMPNKGLLKFSLQTLISCTLLDDILTINVKDIVCIIAMIPHMPTLPSGVMESQFFMMEQPGLEISNLGVPYSGFDIGGGDEPEDDYNDDGDLK
ncbi:hypothetical protein BDR04DRAFT_1121328 [Suillus decipiens]|nr:hypothetical protein BDR04DRAFT_1121328 [Suillus decipiens]